MSLLSNEAQLLNETLEKSVERLLQSQCCHNSLFHRIQETVERENGTSVNEVPAFL